MMIRPFTLFCTILACVSGMVLYTQKHKTTVLDHKIAKIVYDTEKIKARTAMLRTEWTLLNQPDRLKTLATTFLPKLQPLAPTQFTQMASLEQHLPPVEKKQDKDKIRDNLAQSVASNHGQVYKPDTPITQQPNNEQTSIVADNKDNQTKDSSSDLMPADQNPPRKINNRKENNTSTKQAEQKSVTSRALLAKKTTKPSFHYSEQDQNDDKILSDNHAPNSNKIQKRIIKKNIATENNNNQSVHHSTFSIADSTNSSSAKSKEDDHPIKNKHYTSASHPPASASVQSNHSTPIKMARYNIKKKNHHSESAFDDDADDLPAPVPFSQ